MDMLIRLHALPSATADGPAPAGVVVRKPIGPEHDAVVRWVAERFSAGWASEARVALGNRPPTLHVAVDMATDAATDAAHGGASSSSPRLLGFCCRDATALGMVGPVGVADGARGRGVGAALLRACLRDMREAGHAYAVAGWVDAPGFFARVAGAVEIAESSPGPYDGMLRAGD